MSDRPLTPHELHQKSISVLDQLERIAVDWRRGRIPDAGEIDVITAAVIDLRGRVDLVDRGAGDPGPAALGHLEGARRCLAEAIDMVIALAGAHPTVAPPSRAGGRGPDAGSSAAP